MSELDDLLIEVRDSDLTRIGEIDLRDVTDLQLVSRFNNLGQWSLTLPADHEAAVQLRQPGNGIVATLGDDVLLSGPLEGGTRHRGAGDAVGTIELFGVDDNDVLMDEEAFPTPSSVDLEDQTGTAGSGFDQREGLAETLIYGYVGDNIGPTAHVDRQLVVLGTDLARGTTVQGQGRFQSLGELISGLAIAGGKLGFRTRQDDDQRRFEVYAPRDLTKLVRFDLDNDTAEELEYTFKVPALTRAIVGGQGLGALRTLILRTSADSLAAETLWNRRIWRFIDQSSTDDTAGLQQAGDEQLAANGTTTTGLKATPVDTAQTQFAKHYYLGDVVTAVIDDLEVPAIVSEAAIKLTSSGLVVNATLGDPDAAVRDPLLMLLRRSKDQSRRLSRFERS